MVQQTKNKISTKTKNKICTENNKIKIDVVQPQIKIFIWICGEIDFI